MESIAISQIIPSPHNPRKSFDESGLQELAESIRQVGVLQPVVVRRTNGRFFVEPGTAGGTDAFFILDRQLMTPDRGYSGGTPLTFPTWEEAEKNLPAFELVAGERRWRASQAAGLTEIPAVVRDLTDVQAAELAIVENLLRADVSAFEEAMGFRRLIDLGAHTADSLAAKLGKSRSHVFARLRLCKLCRDVRKAMEDGQIEASVAELLAKFGTEALQEEALNELLDSVPKWAEEDEFPIPFRRAKSVLAEFYPDLTDAPWPLKLADFPGGSCKACPKRTANMPDAPAGAKGSNVCTDRHCYRDRLNLVRSKKLDSLLSDNVLTLKTLKDHDEALGDGYSTERGFPYGSPWLAGHAMCYEAQKEASTWDTVLEGLGVEPVTIVDPRGNLVRAYHAKEAKLAAAKAKRITSLAAQEATPKDRSAVIEENKKRRFVENELASMVLSQVASIPPREFLVQYITRSAAHGYHAQKYLASHFGVGIEAVAMELENLSLDRLQAILVAMEISAGDGWNAYLVEKWADASGIDFEAASKTAAVNYKAQAKEQSQKKG